MTQTNWQIETPPWKKRFNDTNKIKTTKINNINIYQKNFSHSAYKTTLFTYA